jgi:hypothetical protein
VTVTFAPAAYGAGGTGGLPGLVVTHPAGLGAEGTFLQDTRAGLVFSSTHFVKGAL